VGVDVDDRQAARSGLHGCLPRRSCARRIASPRRGAAPHRSPLQGGTRGAPSSSAEEASGRISGIPRGGRREGRGRRGFAASPLPSARTLARRGARPELESRVGFEAIPASDGYANPAWQLLSALALDLVRAFPIGTGTSRQPRALERTCVCLLHALATLRLELIHRPARSARSTGRPQPRFAVSPRAQAEIRRYERALDRFVA